MTTMEKALTRSLPNAILGSRLFNDDFFSPSLLRTFFPERAWLGLLARSLALWALLALEGARWSERWGGGLVDG